MGAIEKLRNAYRDNRLTLFLGAGVSMASGLPSWNALVLAMYFEVIDRDRLGNWRPFPNYLLAIAEWQLKHMQEPLEITARKIRKYYADDQNLFRRALWENLYKALERHGEDFVPPDLYSLLDENKTLHGIVDLCNTSDEKGVNAIVTYNYDSLLEMALDTIDHTPIWSSSQVQPDTGIPVYHVHGYVPLPGDEGSSPDEIVFTEDQYNRIANDPYSWANLVQMHFMSSSTGLMIGLSLSDRNMRRLFDAVKSAPLKTQHYALLPRPKWKTPEDRELDKINETAMDYLHKFQRSGIKREPGGKGPNWRSEIKGILSALQSKGVEQEEQVLAELGIQPIWFDDYSEIPDILARIME